MLKDIVPKSIHACRQRQYAAIITCVTSFSRGIGFGVAALPTTFSGVACCSSCPRSLRDLRVGLSGKGSEVAMRKNTSGITLVLSLIGDLFRGNLSAFMLHFDLVSIL